MWFVLYRAPLLSTAIQEVLHQNQEAMGITLPYLNGALQSPLTAMHLKEIIQPIHLIQWRETTG
jgi:hypothetical protein